MANDHETQDVDVEFTPKGFQMFVAQCMTGEVDEHYTVLREGSLLQLADQVARRCLALCEERGVEMDDAIYGEVVAELAPRFAESNS